MKYVVREAGTASPFQIPPRLARLPSVPRPGSARAANAAIPGVCAHIWFADDRPSIDAVNHGIAATTAEANMTAVQSQRERPPGTATHTNPTTAARIKPVGVKPASASQKANTKIPGQESLSDERSVTTVVATQGRQPYPSSRLQCPWSSRSPTYGFQIATVIADELAPRTGFRHQLRCQSGRPPACQPETQDQQRLHHNAAVDTARGQRDREILWCRPWRRDQPERAIGEIRPGRRHRVPQQEIAGVQQRRHHQQRQRQCVPGLRPPQSPHAPY